MKDIGIPVVTGPGSQPAESDGAEMSFMQMPSGMSTFESPLIPAPEEIQGLEPALEMATRLQAILADYRVDQSAQRIDITALDAHNRQFFDQLLGEGEVSVLCDTGLKVRIQESVLAGVWRVQTLDEDDGLVRDTIEVADVPALVRHRTFADAQVNIDVESLQIPSDIYNAAPLLTEISDKLGEFRAGDEPHVINLSLLPHTEQDLTFLSDCLGIGPVIILSRGYGNCRISSTATSNLWWVQYFNSQETLILNTLEISSVPEVACAAQEDISDSHHRLREILSIYR